MDSGLAPETYLRATIVSEKRAKSTCEVYFTSRNSLSVAKAARLPRAAKFHSEFFGKVSVARERASGREMYFPPKRHVPPGLLLYFQERLRKAKEQEEVIHARHCYPTLGTLDRNRTWKPTRLHHSPPPRGRPRALLSPLQRGNPRD